MQLGFAAEVFYGSKGEIAVIGSFYKVEKQSYLSSWWEQYVVLIIFIVTMIGIDEILMREDIAKIQCKCSGNFKVFIGFF